MLAQVLIAEADAFVALWKDLKLPDGRDRIVRHGHGPQRAIQTGVGPVEVRRAKVRDRGDVGTTEKIRFTSAILPKWARRTKSLDALLPVLYLRGVSAGDFQEMVAHDAGWCERQQSATAPITCGSPRREGRRRLCAGGYALPVPQRRPLVFGGISLTSATAGFADTLKNIGLIGMTFGRGCFFGARG
jgi:hypothetical protein